MSSSSSGCAVSNVSKKMTSYTFLRSSDGDGVGLPVGRPLVLTCGTSALYVVVLPSSWLLCYRSLLQLILFYLFLEPSSRLPSMASFLTRSHARLQCSNNVLTPLCSSIGHAIAPGSQCRQFSQRRAYAGLAEVTNGSHLQASMAQHMHFQSHLPAAHNDSVPYWKHIRLWKDVSEEEFLSYRWQVSNLDRINRGIS